MTPSARKTCPFNVPRAGLINRQQHQILHNRGAGGRDDTRQQHLGLADYVCGLNGNVAHGDTADEVGAIRSALGPILLAHAGQAGDPDGNVGQGRHTVGGQHAPDEAAGSDHDQVEVQMLPVVADLGTHLDLLSAFHIDDLKSIGKLLADEVKTVAAVSRGLFDRNRQPAPFQVLREADEGIGTGVPSAWRTTPVTLPPARSVVGEMGTVAVMGFMGWPKRSAILATVAVRGTKGPTPSRRASKTTRPPGCNPTPSTSLASTP